MIPLLFILVGVALDLGWYYFNVSRLQNAADAAVLAGAQDLVARNNTIFKGYNITLVENKFSGYPDPDDDISTAESDEVAADYVRKNLSSDAAATTLKDDLGNAYAYTMIDNWSPNASEVTMTPHLGQDGDVFYYVVHLTENIRHFLMPGRYEPIPAPVVAVAMLTKQIIPDNARPQGGGAENKVEGTDILTDMYNLEDKSVTRNWEVQTYASPADFAKFYNGATKYVGHVNEYQDRKVNYDKNVSTRYRYEKAEVKAGSANQGSSQGTMYNYTEAQGIDSLNLDFKADVQFTKEWSQAEWTDFDIKYSDPSAVTYLNGANSNTADLRIHSTFNFTTPYTVRQNRTEEQVAQNPEDALYVRIESEPIKPLSFRTTHRSYSSVRQIFLNINQPNTGENDRPLVFFYEGPEKINGQSSVRDSQPFVLTLNADARVILFAPYSPVVIRGNNHKMQGFVIAKEFVQLTTASDYYQEGGKYYNSSAKTKEYFYVPEEGTFVDSVGNVQTKPLENATRDRNDSEVFPEGAVTRIQNETYEKVYDFSVFGLAEGSHYDSFKIAELKRNVYTYLDNYTDEEKDDSVDMFFTTMRASWID